jgi:hypothetical protein
MERAARKGHYMPLKTTDAPETQKEGGANTRPHSSPNSQPGSEARSKSWWSALKNSVLPPQLNPEEQELARKLEEQAKLETELAERELRSANLRAELGAFERQYLHHVGSRYAELDELKAAIAERAAKQQPSNERAQRAAREARARAGQTKSVAGEKNSVSPRAFEATPEMKRLYREVAKRIHPDLTSDRDDRAKRQHLMAEANEAYERGDEARLVKIFTEYDWRPEAVQGEGPAAELIRVIRRISQARGRLAEIEAELQLIMRSDLYRLKMRVDEERSRGCDVIKDMVAKVDEQIEEAKTRLAYQALAFHVPAPKQFGQ